MICLNEGDARLSYPEQVKIIWSDELGKGRLDGTKADCIQAMWPNSGAFPMWKLAVILFIIVGPTFAGFSALVPMTLAGPNYVDPLHLVGAAVVGGLLAIPFSFVLASRLRRLA